MILLILTLGAFACPVMRPNRTQENYCAKFENNEILLGTCKDYGCSLDSIIQAYRENTTLVPCNYKSPNKFHIYKETVDIVANPYRITTSMKNLNQNTRQCSQDSDCKLIGGGNWFCECAFDGWKYCLLAPGDDLYESLTNSRNVSYFLEYSMRIHFHPYLNHLPEGTQDFFEDVNYMRNLTEESFRKTSKPSHSMPLIAVTLLIVVIYL